ncbi:glycoside hydrolase family 3 C-terminal domain-containing protein [Actinotalea sp. M2MS4P-6]|uniref:beta-glucosidase n=1 Tax=Actinotalea sp. M2MS4P-6 TaxID=2983762 RepID=UPI0021E3675A|nr:glycoside hydrolase family 3 N-terminal domain-containing protein [Actinotalea sp. M2MS4P-6]MCV2394845.1 glycoside hydrolase family 3 C-terminal domain-containing protein [Actinotalea sp. M2MS4P-6]
MAATALAVVGAVGAVAATTDPDPSAMELAHAELSKQAATQGMVLLENDGGLPMASSGNVALFGVGAYATVKGGTGSGAVNNRYTISVREGFENAGYVVTTSDAYWDAMVAAFDSLPGGGGMFGGVDYSAAEQLLTAETVAPTAETDTALFVVARNSGEGSDRSSGQGDYLLTDTERADIALLGQTYPNVVVVLNVGGVVDTAFFAQVNGEVADPDGGQALDALFLMSQAGQEAGNALVEVLNGTVNPSGKLVDTWAASYDLYPASATFANADGDVANEVYSEGIYVGYRYFDSFAKQIAPDDPDGGVLYPFGYGLSYTDFEVKTLNVSADMDSVTVKVKVTNTGREVSGRDVVQVYFSAPQTGLDKPFQELAGFAKTDELAPRASQILTISFPTTEMSSYDMSKAAYVMDKGDYLIRVGDSSRDTEVVAKIGLGKTLTTEQLSTQVDDQAPDEVLTSDPDLFYSYGSQAKEIRTAQRVNLSTRHFHAADDASVYSQDVPVSADSSYYGFDGDLMSSITAYVDPDQTDWEGTGAPYAAKLGESISYVETDPSITLYDVASGAATMEQLVAGFSVTQLANIVEGASTAGSTLTAAGAAGYTTALYEDQGIPGMTLSDGPAGLRLTQEWTAGDTTYYQWCTAWPIGTMLAQTWDRDLVQQVGAAIGAEMNEYGVTLWLAPGMNIHRDPLNGRNFEYFSEDPLVSGETATAETLGVQSNPGVGVTLKHYVTNNQESNRGAENNVVDERALREIYLKGFQIAVESAQPMAIMTSYNRIQGTYASANYDMNTDLMRGEWGFKGLIMTDWGGSHDPAQVMYSGNDLIMPGNNPSEVMNAMLVVPPTIDVNGLPVYSRSVFTWGTMQFVWWTWSFNGLTLSATGAETVSTTVDATTDLSQVQSMDNGTPVSYASVDEAYQSVMTLLDPATNALNAGQRAAISVTDVVHEVDGDDTSPVVSYTVVMTGDYPAEFLLRLGDLQRSAMRILTIALHSAQFGELAGLQGVDGVDTAPYSGLFDLAEFVSVDLGRVSGGNGHDGDHGGSSGQHPVPGHPGAWHPSVPRPC